MHELELEYPARILVVEDDRTIQVMLKHAFRDVAEVVIAEDGKKGLQLLRTQRPDFVITDVFLPEIDGITLIKKIRRSFLGACTPILVLTASGEENILINCFRQGADDFMAKPFSLSELRMRVASIHVRQRVARDVNPLTKLPGNLVIKREAAARLENHASFAVAYIDIDHFKAFNDTRGFDAGDEVIKLMGDLLGTYSAEASDDEIFVGHIGGDDFLLMLELEQVEPMAAWLFERFSAAIQRFYTPAELAKGTVTITNRGGVIEEVPLLSISIGVVTTERAGLDDFRKIGHIAAEVKKVAKATPGNSLFIERRRVLTQDLNVTKDLVP